MKLRPVAEIAPVIPRPVDREDPAEDREEAFGAFVQDLAKARKLL